MATSTSLPASTATAVVQLTLPAGGAYIVTAATELGGVSTAGGFVNCTLLEGASPIGGGSTELPTQAAFSLSCNPDNAAKARNNVITAIKVGTLHTS